MPPVPISNATESICYTNFNLTVATDHLISWGIKKLELRTTVDLSKRGLDDDDFVFLEERWDFTVELGMVWGSEKISLTDKLTSCSGFKKLDALVQDYLKATAPKIDLEQTNEGLEDEFPLQVGDFQTPC